MKPAALEPNPAKIRGFFVGWWLKSRRINITGGNGGNRGILIHLSVNSVSSCGNCF
jgi:hypothetical protein